MDISLGALRGLAKPLLGNLTLALTLTAALNVAVAQTWIGAQLPNAEQTFLGNNGQPLVGGSVYSYVPNTLVPKSTWIDPFENTLNSEPVTLDSAGRAVIFGQGNYRQRVYDANNNLIWDGLTSAYGSANPSGATGTDTAPVGTVMAFSGFAVPTNWLLAYGQAVSRTTYAQLLTALTISTTTANCVSSSTTLGGFTSTAQIPVGAAIEASCLPSGTTVTSITNSTTIVVSQAATASTTVTAAVFPWGNGDASTTFNLPDLRGRTFAGADAMGGSAASRLTSTYFGASAATPGVAGGTQDVSPTILQANLPSVNFEVTGIALTDPGHTHTYGESTVTNATGGSGAASSVSTQTTSKAFTGITINSGGSGQCGGQACAASGGSGTALNFATIQPTLTVNYIIKVAPNTSGAGGVVSLGGLTGDIICASPVTCYTSANVNYIGVTGGAGVFGPSTTTSGCLAPWANTTGSLLGNGCAISISGAEVSTLNTTGAITGDGWGVASQNSSTNALNIYGPISGANTYFDLHRSVLNIAAGSTTVNISNFGAWTVDNNPQTCTAGTYPTCSGGNLVGAGVGNWALMSANADKAAVWGDAVSLSDSELFTGVTGANRGLLNEFDFGVFAHTSGNGPSTTVQGLTLHLGGTAQPFTGAAFSVSASDTDSVTSAPLVWPVAFDAFNGCCTYAAIIGAVLVSGDSVSSQPIQFNAFDSGGTPISGYLSYSATHQFIFDDPAAINSIAIDMAATGNNPTLTANCGDTNCSLVLAGQGTGGIKTANQFTSTLATGTAPFVVTSTTNVANLNASSLNGATFAAPGAIGGGTAAAGTFTTLAATSTTDSGSDTTGALVIAGGLGIAKTLYLGVDAFRIVDSASVVYVGPVGAAGMSLQANNIQSLMLATSGGVCAGAGCTDPGSTNFSVKGSYYADTSKGVTCSGALTVISSVTIKDGIIIAATGTGGTCS